MRIIGPDAPLREHQHDVLFLGAGCNAHPSAAVKAIGARCFGQLDALRAVGDRLEATENEQVIGQAIAAYTDHVRGQTAVSLGAFIDSLGTMERGQIFRIPPSEMKVIANDRETAEMANVLARLRELPADHPLRQGYETRVERDNQAFVSADTARDEQAVKLAAARFAVNQAKLDNDRFRETVYGELVALLGKANAEALFRKPERRAKKETND